MTFKALGVGLPKTGTSTLCGALRSAGINALHQTSYWRSPPAGALMLQAMEEKLPLGHYLPLIEAVTQLDSCGKHVHAWPQLNDDFLRQFRKEYPEAVVILHTRRIDKTIRSIKRWGNLWDRLRASAPGLKADSPEHMVVRWIQEHYARVRNLFADDPYFVEFDIEDEDAQQALEDALQRSVKWWGVENKWKPGSKG